MKRITAHILIIGLMTLMSCTAHNIKIFHKGTLVADIQDFPSKDTSIQVGNVFIQYHIIDHTLEGKVEDISSGQMGSFKTSNQPIYIEIDDDKFFIHH